MKDYSGMIQFILSSPPLSSLKVEEAFMPESAHQNPHKYDSLKLFFKKKILMNFKHWKRSEPFLVHDAQNNSFTSQTLF